MLLEGSCRCGAVRFRVESRTPYPYMRCYCAICRKTDGGGGYAINIMGDASTLTVEGENDIATWQAPLSETEEGGTLPPSSVSFVCYASMVTPRQNAIRSSMCLARSLGSG